MPLVISYPTLEGIKSRQLKSLTPGFFLPECSQQPVALIQVHICLQSGEEKSGVGRDLGHLGQWTQVLLKEGKQELVQVPPALYQLCSSGRVCRHWTGAGQKAPDPHLCHLLDPAIKRTNLQFPFGVCCHGSCFTRGHPGQFPPLSNTIPISLL